MSPLRDTKPKGPQYLKTTLEVTCPACKETYNIRTDVHEMKRNCRCTKGSFRVQLGTGYNKIFVWFANQYGVESKFTNYRIIAQK
jgi:hypothetical protein